MKKIYFATTVILQLFISGCATTNSNYAVDDYVQTTPNVPDIRYNNHIQPKTSITSFRYDRNNLDGQIDVDLFKNEMVQYINDVRSQGTVCSEPINKPLVWNNILEKAATVHAKDIALNNLFSHDGSGTSQDIAKRAPGVGSRFYERISYFGYPVRPKTIIGETLGLTKTNLSKSNMLYPNFKRNVENLMNSTKHCKIVANNRFDYIGIGVYKVANKYYFVYDFAQKAN